MKKVAIATANIGIWIDYVIASFYDPCVKLVKEKNLTFKEFAKVYVEVRSKEEHGKPCIKGHFNQKKVWLHPCYDKLSAVQTQVNKMNQLGLNDVGQLNNMSVNKFVLNGTFLKFILANQEKVYLEITEEEYIFIRDFIKMSFLVFLPSMVNRICFEIKSDTSCIETAIERGWIQ